MDARSSMLDAANAPPHRRCIRGHFLPERDGYRILQMGTAHFQDIFVFSSLLIQLSSKPRKSSHELFTLTADTDLDGCREGIIRGLRHIRMVIR